MSRNSRDGLDDFVVGIMAVVFIGLVLAFLGIIYALGMWLLRLLFAREEQSGEAPPPPTRMFGAPASARWLAAYDYGLYKLERTTGIEFNTTPSRLMIGSLIITVGAGLTLGIPLFFISSLLNPIYPIAWMIVITVISLVIGGLTGWQLTKSAPGWFDFNGDFGDIREEERNGFTLGEEI